MPVIRVSNETLSRLKAHARPLEDSADDVVRLALDALERRRTGARAKARPGRRRAGLRTPQRAFRIPLLRVVRQLGGAAAAREVRRRLEQILGGRLTSADNEPVSTGDPRWWNAVCFERADLVREGLLETASPRGIWKLSDAGRSLLTELESSRDQASDPDRARRWASENADAIRSHRAFIEKYGAFGDDLRTW